MEATEILFPSQQESSRVARALARGDLRRLGRGIYTPNLVDPPADICRRHWARITSHLFPGAIIADRSVLVGQPDADGYLFVVADRVRAVELPGLTIVPRSGPGPLLDDMPYVAGLWMSSIPRALVDNQRQSRSVKSRPPRTLTEREIADWVDSIVRNYDESKVRAFRDRAWEIALQFEMPSEGRQADRVIGAALQTRTVHTDSPLLAARQSGLPFDPDRDRLLDRLFSALNDSEPMTMTAWDDDAARRATLPFWDAYFSNFIEGTEFTVDEAVAIVFENEIPRGRPADAHDIVDTYRVVADEAEMSKRPSTFKEFEDFLRGRHRRIMLGRLESGPGEYKEALNRAGSTVFVRPELVRGTLLRGWDRFVRLSSPAHRAFFTMFLVAEVHPFADGNGRTARAMMNAELQAKGEIRAIIPIIYRNEYLDSLRRLSRQGDPDLLIRVLQFARRYTGGIDFTDIEVSRSQLEATNAFVPPDEALAKGLFLRIPRVSAVDPNSEGLEGDEARLAAEQQAASRR